MLLYCHCRIIFLLRALLLAPNIFSFFLRLVMSEVYEYLSRFRTSRRPALNRSCFVVSRGDYDYDKNIKWYADKSPTETVAIFDLEGPFKRRDVT